jgi:hypothetical protein
MWAALIAHVGRRVLVGVAALLILRARFKIAWSGRSALANRTSINRERPNKPIMLAAGGG